MNQETQDKKSWVQWILLAFVLVAVGFVLHIIPWEAFEDREAFMSWVQGLKGNPWAAPIFVSAYAVSCLVVPVTPFTISGGVLFGFWKGTALNILASNVGTWMAFGIARVLGRGVVQKLMRGKVKILDEGLKRNGFWGILVIRLIGLPPFIVTNYAAGLSQVSVRDYVLATFIGIIPWAVGITYFSDVFWQRFVAGGLKGVQEAVVRRLGWVTVGLILVGLVIGATVYFFKKRRSSAFHDRMV